MSETKQETKMEVIKHSAAIQIQKQCYPAAAQSLERPALQRI